MPAFMVVSDMIYPRYTEAFALDIAAVLRHMWHFNDGLMTNARDDHSAASTGTASPRVCRVSVNDAAAPIMDKAPASMKAEAKLPVACTI